MERGFTCKDCGTSFDTAALFTAHFIRDESNGMTITGCRIRPLAEVLSEHDGQKATVHNPAGNLAGE